MVPVPVVQPTAIAMNASTSPGPPISAPGPEQLGSAGGQGLEEPTTVSDHAVLAIVVADDWSI